MALEMGGRILCQLPVGNPADTADPFKPFISQPACGPAVSGISDQKRFVAVGCNPGLTADDIDRLDSMQQPPARRPELYFFYQPKKLHALSIVAPGRLFGLGLIPHNTKFPGEKIEHRCSTCPQCLTTALGQI